MSSISLHVDHPTDALPDYVRGQAPNAEAIESHLARCESCRVEVQVLRALHDSGPAAISDVERQRLFRLIDDRRTDPVPRQVSRSPSATAGAHTVGPSWLTATWRIAAAVAVLLTSVGVWQVVESGSGAGDWNPEAALENWGRDLAELDVGPGAVQAAFGLAVVDEVPWEDLEGVDPADFRAPWEEN